MTEHTNETRELIDEVIEYVDGLNYYPSVDTALGLVLWALVSKGIVVGKSICTLVDEGYLEEAFGMSRTMTDLFFTIRYIANKESEERATTFANFAARDSVDWLEIIKKHYPENKLSDIPKLPEMKKIAKDYPNPHKWTGLGDQTKRMALEDDEYEKDAKGIPIKFEFDYDVIYKWTSHFVHPTIVALESHIFERPEKFRVHSRKACGLKFRNLALFNVVASLNKMLICVLRRLGIEFPEQLSMNFDHAMNNLKP